MSNTVFTDVIAVLKDAGYIVNLSPQEKQLFSSKELVIIIGDIELNVESTVSYIQMVTVDIIMNIKTAADVITLPATLAMDIEKGIATSNGFKFENIKVDILGTLYQVTLSYSYKEVLYGTE